MTDISEVSNFQHSIRDMFAGKEKTSTVAAERDRNGPTELLEGPSTPG